MMHQVNVNLLTNIKIILFAFCISLHERYLDPILLFLLYVRIFQLVEIFWLVAVVVRIFQPDSYSSSRNLIWLFWQPLVTIYVLLIMPSEHGYISSYMVKDFLLLQLQWFHIFVIWKASQISDEDVYSWQWNLNMFGTLNFKHIINENNCLDCYVCVFSVAYLSRRPSCLKMQSFIFQRQTRLWIFNGCNHFGEYLATSS